MSVRPVLSLRWTEEIWGRRIFAKVSKFLDQTLQGLFQASHSGGPARDVIIAAPITSKVTPSAAYRGPRIGLRFLDLFQASHSGGTARDVTINPPITSEVLPRSCPGPAHIRLPRTSNRRQKYSFTDASVLYVIRLLCITDPNETFRIICVHPYLFVALKDKQRLGMTRKVFFHFSSLTSKNATVSIFSMIPNIKILFILKRKYINN